MTEQFIPYQPDTYSAPGEMIAELLEERGLNQRYLAERMGRPQKTINELIHGKVALTPETAQQLELVLGTPAQYWLTHEAHYRAYLTRRAQEERYSAWHDWLDQMPVDELKRQGVLPPIRNQGRNKNQLVRALLQFFGVASPAEWENIYLCTATANVRWRIQEQRSDPHATSVWLRLGERAAQTASLAVRYDAARFRALLPTLRSLTVEPPSAFMPRLMEQCAAVGVVVAFVRAVPRACVSGAARWLCDRPVIQLSLYGKFNDRFWFTFFHEVNHILEHKSRIIFLDEWDHGDVSAEEQQADRFAADLLIPPEHAPGLSSLRSADSVRSFAAKIGIHPGIVVGRLQHDGILPQTHLNSLKERIDWNPGDAA